MKKTLLACICILISCCRIYPAAAPEFAIVVASYNNEQWCLKNIQSCTGQTYPYWHLYYINDASTDKTGKIVANYIRKHSLQKRCTIINNDTRMGALQNIYNTVHMLEPEKIVVLVDGDDFLSSSTVLEKVAKAYRNENIWMTYGSYIDWPSQNVGWCAPFPEKIAKKNRYRQYKWVSSHLRTFYAALFQKIAVKDLIYRGSFYSVAGDLAIMFPMLEMCGPRHYAFIKKILYLYNRQNPISDFRIQRPLQIKCEEHIRNKIPYQRLDNLLS